MRGSGEVRMRDHMPDTGTRRQSVPEPADTGGWPTLLPEAAMRLRPSRKEQWLRLLFPARCVLCDAVLPQDRALLVCDPCRCILVPAQPQWMPCPDWPELDAWYGAFPYAGGVEQAIRRMKYNGCPGYAGVLGFLLATAAAELVSDWRMGAVRGIPSGNAVMSKGGIVPVPMHPRKERARGYNQSVLIAQEVGKEWNMDVYPFVVRKTGDTAAQNGKGRQRRHEVLAGAFAPCIGGEAPLEPDILLIDDVVTTGSTLRACASAVRHAYGLVGVPADAVRIRALTIAYA